MKPIILVIPGNSVPLERPRVTRTGMTDTSMTADQYRALVGAEDGPHEVSAARYRQIVGGPASAADYVGRRNLDSSKVDIESPAKATFREWLQHATELDVVEEFLGIPGRRFRFDWYIPGLKIAFEYNGVMHHATKAGAWRDAEKSNLAQLHGILFIQVNAESVRSGTAFEFAEWAILQRLGAKR